MTRKSLLVVGAMLLGIAGGGVSEARPDAPCAWDAKIFRYCGEYVPASRLPLSLGLNEAGAPSSLTANPAAGDEVAAAARAAADEWNLRWPGDPGVLGCSALCIEGKTTRGFDPDGHSTVLWGSPAMCGGTPASVVAVACMFYESSSGAGARRILEVDVILNPSYSWAYPHVRLETGSGSGGVVADNPQAVALGEAHGAFPFGNPPLGEKFYDLQSALTHEFGHALGLDDIGNMSTKWPNDDPADVAAYGETMYRWYYSGTTNKRSLGVGDIIGLQLAARDSTSHP